MDNRRQTAALIDPIDMPAFYRPNETTLGSFSFYTGRRVIVIENKQDLKKHMSRHPDKILLVRKGRWPFKQNPEDLGRQRIGSVLVGDKRHIFILRYDSPIELQP